MEEGAGEHGDGKVGTDLAVWNVCVESSRGKISDALGATSEESFWVFV
jgi:hypothetical protein